MDNNDNDIQRMVVKAVIVSLY